MYCYDSRPQTLPPEEEGSGERDYCYDGVKL